MEQSVTSASMVKPSGMSILSERSSLKSRLAFRPGTATPTTISLSPSEITFPLSMVTLEKLSEERIIPVTITNGEYTSTSLSSTFTVFLDLFV